MPRHSYHCRTRLLSLHIASTSLRRRDSRHRGKSGNICVDRERAARIIPQYAVGDGFHGCFGLRMGYVCSTDNEIRGSRKGAARVVVLRDGLSGFYRRPTCR